MLHFPAEIRHSGIQIALAALSLKISFDLSAKQVNNSA